MMPLGEFPELPPSFAQELRQRTADKIWETMADKVVDWFELVMRVHDA